VTITSSEGKQERTTGQAEHDAWMEDAEKALGNILLRLHPNIGYQFNNATGPSILWQDLQTRFGKPGMATAFMEIKGIMDTAIPNNSDPNPALNKIMAHFLHLKEMDYEISNRVQGMMILAKASASSDIH
jgi:hypothetical protein